MSVTPVHSAFTGRSIAAQAFAANGGTFSVQRSVNGVTVEPVAFVDGYMVSVAGAERKVAAVALTDAVIGEYIGEHYANLIMPGYYFGVWIADGVAYLDVSRHILDVTKAIAAGKADRQLAIFDCANGKVVEL